MPQDQDHASPPKRTRPPSPSLKPSLPRLVFSFLFVSFSIVLADISSVRRDTMVFRWLFENQAVFFVMSALILVGIFVIGIGKRGSSS
jgi:hypothetical protein